MQRSPATDLYGTKGWCSTREVMTRLSVSRLLLISPASRARVSLAPDRPTFSDPARSTRFSLPHLMSSSPSAVVSFMCMMMEKIECERLHAVTPQARRALSKEPHSLTFGPCDQ